jgi:glycosyltransferase involved in cell wall biosynthesis
MINILHLRSTSGYGGGAEHVIFNICQNLPTELFNTEICFLRPINEKEFPLLQLSKDKNIKAFDIPIRGKIDIKAILLLRTILKNKNIHIIHTHDYKADLYGYFASRKLNISIVSTMHGWIFNNKIDKLYYNIDKLFLKHFKLITCVSNPLIEMMISDGIPSSKLVYIPNSVDNIYLNKHSKSKHLHNIFNLSESIPIIGCIGRLRKEKGQICLLKAFNSIKEKCNNCHIVFVGDGPDKDYLEQYAVSNNIQNRIHFVNYQTNIINIYSEIDLLVLPSFTEGLPLVVLEAMAMGIPVIATNVGGVKDLVHENLTGQLIDSGNIHQMASAILRYFDNQEYFQTLAYEAKELINRYYSNNSIIHKYQSLYKNCI